MKCICANPKCKQKFTIPDPPENKPQPIKVKGYAILLCKKCSYHLVCVTKEKIKVDDKYHDLFKGAAKEKVKDPTRKSFYFPGTSIPVIGGNNNT